MENNKIISPTDMAKQADELFVKQIKEGKYQDLLNTMDTLGNYTLRNQILILSQRPDAKNVKNLTSWRYHNRNVIPGEVSLKILAPTFVKQSTVNANGTVTEKTLDKVNGYEVRYAFDESQTEGEPIQDIISADIPNKYDLMTAALKGTVKGFEFGFSGELDDDTDAMLDTESNTILIREGMPQDKTLKSLIHQIVAANILTKNRLYFRGLGSYLMPNITSVEISGASFVVGKRLGLEMPLILPDFTDMSDENIARFANNVNLIRSVSQKMIAAVENAIEEQLNAEKDTELEKENIVTPAKPKITEVKTTEKKTNIRQSQMTKAEVVM